MEDVLRIDYDSNWKLITVAMLPDFILFFLPELYDDIDWSVEPELLEQEFFDFVEDQKTKNITDKLIKFKLKTGEEKWIFIHVEFQGEGSIVERMFTYYRRILDKYGKEITAIVIYTGKSTPKNYNKYESSKYGTTVTYTFNSYIVAKQNEAKLLQNPNPFALVVLANLYVLKTQDNLYKRLTFKESLHEIAKNRGYSLEKTTELFIFVKELMRLPVELEEEFNNYVINQQIKENKMRIVSQGSKNYVSNIVKDLFGKSVYELTQENEVQNAALIRAIINFKDKMNLNAEQIATMLDIDIIFVENVLTHVED